MTSLHHASEQVVAVVAVVDHFTPGAATGGAEASVVSR